jgi:hypothetical protein
MRPENLEALKAALERLHNNTAFAFNHAIAVENMLRRRPDLWAEYQKALGDVVGQPVHQDFGSLLDNIQ